MKLSAVYDLFGPSLGVSNRQAVAFQEELKGFKGFPVGRPGRAGGASVTPAAMAYFVIAAMVGGPKREARARMWRWFTTLQEGCVRSVWEGEEESDKTPPVVKCPVTGEHLFGEALKAILADPALAMTVEQISVVQEWPEAVIIFNGGDDDGGTVTSRFIDAAGEAHAKRTTMPGSLRTITSVGGFLLTQIAMDMAAVMSEPPSVPLPDAGQAVG